jgi:hypothetical protein
MNGHVRTWHERLPRGGRGGFRPSALKLVCINMEFDQNILDTFMQTIKVRSSTIIKMSTNQRFCQRQGETTGAGCRRMRGDPRMHPPKIHTPRSRDMICGPIDGSTRRDPSETGVGLKYGQNKHRVGTLTTMAFFVSSISTCKSVLAG